VTRLIVKDGDPSLGHCWPPTTPIAVNAAVAGVFVDGRTPVVVGDAYNIHPGPCGVVPTHPVLTAVGSLTVFIGNMPVVRDTDLLSCGDIAKSLAGTVFAG
tara:strand:+ start:656 stop:958 length:303 start_codon:yes stop_codon:yes gene_type:complete